MDHTAFRAVVYATGRAGFPDLQLPPAQKMVQDLCSDLWAQVQARLVRKMMFPGVAKNVSMRFTRAEAIVMVIVLSQCLTHADPYVMNSCHRAHADLFRQLQ